MLATFSCANLSAKVSAVNLGILFSTIVRAVLVIKLAILCLLPLTSFILALRVVLLGKSVISVFYFEYL